MSEPTSKAASPAASSSTTDDTDLNPKNVLRGWRFWAVFPAICVTSLLAAVESTVTSTALPYIVHQLNAGEVYVCTVFLPLCGQMCDLFGRRWMMIGLVSFFAFGSGISGGASNAAMMIAGRAIQGIGGGGINFMIELIVSDLVPLRDRGTFMGVVFAVFSLGTALGPFIGGAIVQNTSWRWVFFINLPIAATALVLHILFLRVNYDRETSITAKLKKIDYFGNGILIGSIVAVLIALSWGGSKYAWSSYHIIVPLVLGVVGMVIFHWYETMPWVKNPTLPSRIFTRRTPAAALIIAFINFMLLYWVLYFLPIYFQAVLRMSPIFSGVALLPTVLLSVVTGIIAGIILTRTGRYRPLHIAAFALITLGFGLFTRFDASTSKAEWIIVQCIPAIGMGLMMTANLPAVQADFPESDTAVATGAFAFMRAYGSIWGISIPAAIFNAQFDSQLYRIDDAGIRQKLSNGKAYSYANADLINSFPDNGLRAQVIDVYTRSLRLTWYVSLAFGALGFLLCFVEKEISLRQTLDTKFGLEPKVAADAKEKSTEKDPKLSEANT
ncbi:major facilitator superfamily domain-containing protein [Trichoderma velutinum]